MPAFTAPCHQERAIVLINNSNDVLTFYAMDTGGYNLKTDVPAHTAQREWLQTGTYRFLVDKAGETINSFPGDDAYLKLDSGTLDSKIYTVKKTSKATWILWNVDTVAKFHSHDPTIWYDMTASANYAFTPVGFMYGDDKNKDGAWFLQQLLKLNPKFYSGKAPFVAFAKSTYNVRVLGPKDKLPKTVGQYDMPYTLTAVDTALGRQREAITDLVRQDLMNRDITTITIDYGGFVRFIGGGCK
jgi:hypothetical protein